MITGRVAELGSQHASADRQDLRRVSQLLMLKLCKARVTEDITGAAVSEEDDGAV